MRVEDIARICHEANKVYCESLGDTSQLHWEDAPEWQRISAINGVQFKLDSHNVTDANMHDNWMMEKILEGWRYGEVKDPEAKTHPCLVEYSQLPKEQQLKDKLFSAIVGAFK